MSQRRLDHLGSPECFDLLRQKELGRLVYVDEKGPVAVPVNYAVDGEKVVFRIGHSPKEVALTEAVAFEVDHVDPSDHSGWSVLLRGTVDELEMEEVVELLHRVNAGFPRPWAEGVHNVWMALTPTDVSGRRLGETTSNP